jgi:hypothetical protein
MRLVPFLLALAAHRIACRFFDLSHVFDGPLR